MTVLVYICIKFSSKKCTVLKKSKHLLCQLTVFVMRYYCMQLVRYVQLVNNIVLYTCIYANCGSWSELITIIIKAVKSRSDTWWWTMSAWQSFKMEFLHIAMVCPCWIDHLIRNSCIESMPSTMYNGFCLLLSWASMTPKVEGKQAHYHAQLI